MGLLAQGVQGPAGSPRRYKNLFVKKAAHLRFAHTTLLIIIDPTKTKVTNTG